MLHQEQKLNLHALMTIKIKFLYQFYLIEILIIL